MSFLTDFDIERYGLINTILSGNPNHFVTGYCKILEGLRNENDLGKIKTLLPKLLSWYDEGNYDRLMENEYTYNKSSHEKTYELLKDFIEELGIEYKMPAKKIEIKKKTMFTDDTMLVPFPPYVIENK